jgi:uncharacterized protein YaiE (UPF0345 family)
MLPGEYEFGTAEKEIMEILAGEMDVCLPGESWKTIVAASLLTYLPMQNFS